GPEAWPTVRSNKCLPCPYRAFLPFNVSISSATSAYADEQRPARERRFATAKVAVAVSFLLVLGYLGYQGRQQAMLEARLKEMAPIRSQIQEGLNADKAATKRFLAQFQGATIDTEWPPSNQELSSLASSLGALIARFESDYSKEHLPKL